LLSDGVRTYWHTILIVNEVSKEPIMGKIVFANPRMLKALVFIFLALLFLGACVAVRVNHCEQPKTPVYPESTLVDYEASGIGRSRPMVTYDYTSTDSPEKIVAFYKEKGFCREPVFDPAGQRNRQLCQGNATPYGEYFVYIDLGSHMAEGITTYALEVRWHGCSDQLE
jgi:hypothetical protein